jgi:hypothetical protein
MKRTGAVRKGFRRILMMATAVFLSASAVKANTLDVCATCPFTTIVDAYLASSSGDIINILDSVHTEHDLILFGGVDLTIQGQGPERTILQSSAVPGMPAGGIYLVGSWTLRDMTIRNNYDGVDIGGAIVKVSNCVIRDNLGAGIVNGYHLEVVDSLIENNLGLGIDNQNGRLTVLRSAIIGNGGGGLSTVGPDSIADLANVTISRNHSPLWGGGIFTIGGGASISLINSTITGNSADIDGGGIAITDGMFTREFPMSILNSIVSGNAGHDCYGFPLVPDGAVNLSGDGTCQGFSIPFGNAGLQPLADNGGPTPTHALERTSDAVNAGDNSVCASAAVGGVDQRGTARPQGRSCDLGAFELVLNRPPDCSEAVASIGEIWPPDHRFVPVGIAGLRDPDGDPLTVRIDSVFQDEPVAAAGFSPDAIGVGTSAVAVRAERDGSGNGRVYHLRFMAADGQGGTCSGEVLTGVAKDLGGGAPVDDGPLFDSTTP